MLPYSQRLMAMVAVATCVAGSAFAQSSTRTYVPQTTRSGSSTRPAPMSSTTVQPGSTTRSVASTPVGLQGYCPVCIIDMKKWVAGKPTIQATYDGKVYYFPGEEQRRMFMSNPEKYVPVLGGDCAVCLTEMSQRSPGSIRFAALSQNRLYLFPDEATKQMFAAAPRKYINADVALGGKCTVCRVEMQQDVAGNPDISLRHGGLKYQFATEDQRKMFISNPAKYAVQ